MNTVPVSASAANHSARFRSAVRRTTQWAVATSLAVTIVYLVLGELLVGLFTDLQEVRTAARQYLPWLIVSPLLSVWSFQLDGIFIGTARSAEMRNAMILSTALFVSLVLLLMPALGNHGLWLSLMAFMVLRAITLGWYYPGLERSIEGRE